MNGVVREVAQGVVHPAHVPLEPESQSPHLEGSRHVGPSGRLLGDDVWMSGWLCGAELAVEVAEKVDGLEVLAPTEGIGNPLAGFARVVAVQHRSHPVYAQTVRVIGVEPEQRARGQEAAHLVAAVIEDQAVPVGMEALAGIGVLVEVAAIEFSQPMGVRSLESAAPGPSRAARRCRPRWRASISCISSWGARRRWLGREVAGDLVAPGTEKGMLHHPEGSCTCVNPSARAHAPPAGDASFEVAQRAPIVAGLASPGTQVNLVDRHRGAEPLAAGPARSASARRSSTVAPGPR